MFLDFIVLLYFICFSVVYFILLSVCCREENRGWFGCIREGRYGGFMVFEVWGGIVVFRFRVGLGLGFLDLTRRRLRFFGFVGGIV